MTDRQRYIAIRAYAVLVGIAGFGAVTAILLRGWLPLPGGEALQFSVLAIALMLLAHQLPVVHAGPTVVVAGSIFVLPVLAVGGPAMLVLAVAAMALGSFALWREPLASYVFKTSFNAGANELAAAAVALLWTRLGSVPPVVDGLSLTAVFVASLIMWALPLALILGMLGLTGGAHHFRGMVFSADSAVSWFSALLAMAVTPVVREGGTAGMALGLLILSGAVLFLWWASRLEASARRYEELFQATERLTREMDSVSEAANAAADAMAAATLSDAALVGVLGSGGIRVLAARGLTASVESLPVEGSVEKALTTRSTVAVQAGKRDAVTDFLGRRRLIVPLETDGECIGVIAAGDKTGVSVVWSPDQVSMAELVARIAGGAIAAAARAEELELLAETDELTGLGNLRAFRAALREFVKKERGALLFVDIDGFKQVNDRWGHKAGDAVLKGVAKALRSAVREKDKVFRYAGDEFVTLLDGAGCDAAGSVVARIEERMGELEFVFGGEAYVPSVSVGFAVIPEDGTDERELVAAADRHMYERKRGRRRLENGGEHQ